MFHAHSSVDPTVSTPRARRVRGVSCTSHPTRKSKEVFVVTIRRAVSGDYQGSWRIMSSQGVSYGPSLRSGPTVVCHLKCRCRDVERVVLGRSRFRRLYAVFTFVKTYAQEETFLPLGRYVADSRRADTGRPSKEWCRRKHDWPTRRVAPESTRLASYRVATKVTFSFVSFPDNSGRNPYLVVYVDHNEVRMVCHRDLCVLYDLNLCTWGTMNFKTVAIIAPGPLSVPSSRL